MARWSLQRLSGWYHLYFLEKLVVASWLIWRYHSPVVGGIPLQLYLLFQGRDTRLWVLHHGLHTSSCPLSQSCEIREICKIIDGCMMYVWLIYY